MGESPLFSSRRIILSPRSARRSEPLPPPLTGAASAGETPKATREARPARHGRAAHAACLEPARCAARSRHVRALCCLVASFSLFARRRRHHSPVVLIKAFPSARRAGRLHRKSRRSAAFPHYSRTTPALLPQLSRTTPAVGPHYSRTTPALLPHYSRTAIPKLCAPLWMVSPLRLNKHDYNAIRLSRWLIGGGSAANLKHMCTCARA